MKTKLAKIILVCAMWLCAFQIAAQPYSIDWNKVAGGGGSGSNGQFTLSGTIGQHDAGSAMTVGNYTLTGGFWSITAVPTPGSPLLSIRFTSTNTVIVSWPSSSTGFVLQQNSDLSNTNWVAPLETTSDDSTNRFIIVSPLAGNRFYRLLKP
jgi:hypothetical protein